ncbi:hypothetical protein [Pseudovibrio brasiliensis]|uniref:Uncharacterized protein n=1 Tax=Pseudovibrio brasiliensis TaxID=1898042 RepID=A0ABX8AI85_9HYPH|nr:hypothetical protein [Pseudovibrio brasiliensis]QUS54510.1 hypothetical protein KGB56_14030 [Pseudovibrio brasiliensis]
MRPEITVLYTGDNEELYALYAVGHLQLGDLQIMHEFCRVALIHLKPGDEHPALWPHGLCVTIEHAFLEPCKTEPDAFYWRHTRSTDEAIPVTGFAANDELLAFAREHEDMLEREQGD